MSAIPKSTTLVFLGRSGCGKDTQIEFLRGRPDFKEAVQIITGELLRELATHDTVLGRRVKTILEKGELAPSWLSFYLWLTHFIEKVKGEEILFSSGSPRRLEEAILNDNVLDFLGRPKAIGIYLNVSRDEVVRRLLLRARSDDKKDSIEERMSYFDRDVLPAVSYYRDSGKLIEVNGEQAPKEVFKELEGKLDKYFNDHKNN